MGFLGDLFKTMFVNNPSYSNEFEVECEINKGVAAVQKVHSKLQKGGQLSYQHMADDNSAAILEYRVNMPDGQVDIYKWTLKVLNDKVKIILPLGY